MAVIYPTLEIIKRGKVKPTAGELFLINYLIANLSNDIEIYFQPFINGDRPDIILMQKDVGVTIIEVKDWTLDYYYVDKDNRWHLNRDNEIIKSPFTQVQHYKDSLFNLHINGLLERKYKYEHKNQSIYGKIKTFVYFHNTSNREFDKLYIRHTQHYRNLENKCHDEYNKNIISNSEYNLKLDNIKRKKQISDLDYTVVTQQTLHKIKMPPPEPRLLTDEIYKEFHRYLKPPFHALNDGIKINYTKTQVRLSASTQGYMKIKGVAGSGKTTLLAKRAVNAHKRHNERVLILTFNISLINYIHDKISDVREGFNWGNFYITYYHLFFRTAAKNTSKNIKTISIADYSDISYFNNHKDELLKYDTILIDEIQDYKLEWVKIIRDNFLKENGEMVVYGDEKQNIYERALDEEKRIIVPNGFGRWQSLKTSIRYQGDGGRILNLTKKFQQGFLKTKYIIDENEKLPIQSFLTLGMFQAMHTEKLINEKDEVNVNVIVKTTDDIYKHIREHDIHLNDVCILSSRIDVLREMDFHIRNVINAKTSTTFETKEMYDELKKRYDKSKEDKKLDYELEKLRRYKKRYFHQNRGVIKLSTIHSFKGIEAESIFLIIDEKDKEEMIYTAITRSKFNLMVYLPEHNKFNEFFTKELASAKSVKVDENKDVFEELKTSVAMRRMVNFDYKVHGKITNHIDVKPYKILFMNDNYYLACEVDNKYKFTMFRVSSISNLVSQNSSFYYDIDIQNFVADIQTPFATYREGYKDYLLKVIVEIDKEKAHIFEAKNFLASQKKEGVTQDGNLRLSFSVTQALEVEELIKRWLPFMKVIEPIELDEKIKADIKKYLYTQ